MASTYLMHNQQPNVVVVQQATRVYGVSIPNPKAAKLTRRVMRLSLMLVFIQLAYAMYNSVALEQNYFLVEGFLVWLLPLCGYFGAKHRNRALIVAYSLLNCIFAIFLPISLIGIAMIIQFITRSLPELCPSGPEGYPHWEHNSTVYADGHKITCADLYKVDDSAGSIYAFLLPIGILSTIIACLSCTWGFQLANTRYFTVPMTQFTTGTVSTISHPASGYAAAQPAQAYATTQPVQAYVTQAKVVPPISTV